MRRELGVAAQLVDQSEPVSASQSRQTMSSATLATIRPSGVAATSRIHFACASTARILRARLEVPPDQLAVVAARDQRRAGHRQAGHVAVVPARALRLGLLRSRSTS